MIFEADGIPKICPLLSNDCLDVKVKAISAIHNLSADLKVVHLIHELNVIPTIISLLQ